MRARVAAVIAAILTGLGIRIGVVYAMGMICNVRRVPLEGPCRPVPQDGHQQNGSDDAFYYQVTAAHELDTGKR
jgi:hypothetical protein